MIKLIFESRKGVQEGSVVPDLVNYYSFFLLIWGPKVGVTLSEMCGIYQTKWQCSDKETTFVYPD